tara:strand:+ start:3565 stop:4230 length:666 start_codon:yes stop_codon:yes gene_type:complete
MQSDNISISAIVPVRAGSKRVVDKNIRPFAETTLLELKIDQLLAVSRIDRVYVSSDSDSMLAIASSKGCIPLKRPSEFASDTIPMSDVYAHLASVMEGDTVLFTHVTNPLCASEKYSEAIDKYATRAPIYDSVTTVSEVKDFLYLNGKAMNFDPQNKPRSQDLPAIVKLNHAISIAPRDCMIQNRNIFGKNPLFVKIDELSAFDVDNVLEFEIAEYLYLKS